mmetsp:Transcript_58553/g.174347  ORF Transcript_58553/g.174347 Transcript_58553/m.174347 type:complete len:219 (-) Transcript_58553:65-721(-)
MLLTRKLSALRRCPCTHARSAVINRRFLSRGALAGGFNKEALRRWAALEWGESSWSDFDDEVTDGAPYTDLFSRAITKECSSWLNSNPRPSSVLGRSFFGSSSFAPERTVLTPFFSGSRGTLSVPTRFDVGEKFLAWTVAVRSPHELICTWSIGGAARGCTMVAFDPALKKVFHGSAVESSTKRNIVFQTMLPMHVRYSQFLLAGMADHLEGLASSQK